MAGSKREREREQRLEAQSGFCVGPIASALESSGGGGDMAPIRIALAQINTVVGDLDGNTTKVLEYIDRARQLGADLVAFPELTITGYPPEDLLLKPKFINENLEQLRRVVAASQGITVIVGFVDLCDDIYNSAAILQNGRVTGVYHKSYLPTYGVFDEDRYFQRGNDAPIYSFGEVTIGVNICEDIWYPSGPSSLQSAKGAQIIVNINGSPYHCGKREHRERMLATRASDDSVIMAYVNLVGGQDELVFDGGSAIFDQRGEMIARASDFSEDLLVADLDVSAVLRTQLHDPRLRKERRKLVESQIEIGDLVYGQPLTPKKVKPELPVIERTLPAPQSSAEMYAALVLGTGDYVRKNGFKKVILGLSGGVDSAITAVIAVDALGAENVAAVAMPSRFSSSHSLEDAELLAKALGIQMLTVPIEPAFHAMLEMLREPFEGTEPGIAEENVQARIRGNILMALSNKFGYLVLTTGNKSEYATGYTTLYGDMAGGFAVLKDVYKTTVYELCRYRNTVSAVIPERILTKPPSAELRPNQKDQDSLPPYEILDPILRAHVEDDRSFEEIVRMGFDVDLVKRVIRLVDRNEYKRRQAPPGVKITPRAFGRDRRLPITSRYRGW